VLNVKRGSKKVFICSGCGKEIPINTPHVRSASGKPYKRYHDNATCLPKKDPDNVVEGAPVTNNVPPPETA
jgi:hypothetical protein